MLVAFFELLSSDNVWFHVQALIGLSGVWLFPPFLNTHRELYYIDSCICWEDAVSTWTEFFCKDLQLHLVLRCIDFVIDDRGLQLAQRLGLFGNRAAKIAGH